MKFPDVLYDGSIPNVKSEKIVEPQGTEVTEEETVLILPEFDNEDESNDEDEDDEDNEDNDGDDDEDDDDNEDDDNEDEDDDEKK